MKKIILITLSLLLISSFLIANEFSAYYSSKRIDKGVGSERYWHLRDIYLDWEFKDFSTALNITELTANPPKMQVEAAWIKFNLLTSYFSSMQRYEWFTLDMQVGKAYFPFSRVSPYASENISVFQPETFGNSWMINMIGTYCSRYHFNLYWADGGTPDGTTDEPSTIGTQATVDMGDIEAGFSFRSRQADNDSELDFFEDVYNDYGVHLNWHMFDMMDLNLQVYRFVKESYSKKNIGYFATLAYSKGFNIPFFNKTIPYVGYFSKRDGEGNEAKEYNMIAGLNMKPHENIFMKLEYNNDSLDNSDPNVLSKHNLNVSNALSFEFGLLF